MNKVLIVDDEVRFLQSNEAGLASYSTRFNVLTAINSREALETLEREQIDLLVTDLRMPEMDGFALLVHASVVFPFMPIIVMTAFATPEIEERININGTAKLLEKPVEFERLLDFLWQTFCNSSPSNKKPAFLMSKMIGRMGTFIWNGAKSPQR